MPIHDWSRVDAGIFHDFHHAWIEEIKRSLNRGLLPPDYYALAEQITGPMGPDVLTLRAPDIAGHRHSNKSNGAGVAVAERPPKVRFHMIAEASEYAEKANKIVIRHRSGHGIVAMVEIVSPGNKSSGRALTAFVQKTEEALAAGIHLLVVDLFPPGPRDPQGIHGVIWGELGGWQQSYEQSSGKPLTLVAYAAGFTDSAYVQPLAVGEPLPEMPLFLTPDDYVNTPLEETYLAAYQGVPRLYREQLEAL